MEDSSVAEFILSQAEGLPGSNMKMTWLSGFSTTIYTPLGLGVGYFLTNKMWREEKVRRPGGCYSDPSPR